MPRVSRSRAYPPPSPARGRPQAYPEFTEYPEEAYEAEYPTYRTPRRAPSAVRGYPRSYEPEEWGTRFSYRPAPSAAYPARVPYTGSVYRTVEAPSYARPAYRGASAYRVAAAPAYYEDYPEVYGGYEAYAAPSIVRAVPSAQRVRYAPAAAPVAAPVAAYRPAYEPVAAVPYEVAPQYAAPVNYGEVYSSYPAAATYTAPTYAGGVVPQYYGGYPAYPGVTQPIYGGATVVNPGYVGATPYGAAPLSYGAGYYGATGYPFGTIPAATTSFGSFPAATTLAPQPGFDLMQACREQHPNLFNGQGQLKEGEAFTQAVGGAGAPPPPPPQPASPASGGLD